VPEATRKTLRAFQQQQGLAVDGYASDRTRAALRAAVAASTAEAERLAVQQRQRRDAKAAAQRAEAERHAEAERQAEEAAAKAEQQPFRIFRDRLGDGSAGPDIVALPAGDFLMGSPENEPGRRDDERQHAVRVGPFAMCRTEVTFDEYDAFAKATGRALPDDSGWGRGSQPVVNVNWDDATAYVEWLSEQTGSPYRLPTEAEREYAARAGTDTRWSFGDDEAGLAEHAWYDNNALYSANDKRCHLRACQLSLSPS